MPSEEPKTGISPFLVILSAIDTFLPSSPISKLFAYFYNLGSSCHTLAVENVNEGTTLFSDYYLVEPIPPDELTKSMGNLWTGRMPLSTSISEDPILVKTGGFSRNAAAGSLVGAVISGLLLAFLIAIFALFLWRRRGDSKLYYYEPAAVHEVLFDGACRCPGFTAMLHDLFY